MRIKLKSEDEIRLMRETNLVLSEILDEICAAARPGVSRLRWQGPPRGTGQPGPGAVRPLRWESGPAGTRGPRVGAR